MTGRHAPPPTYPSRLWLAIMAAAVAGIVVPPTVLAARAVAPQAAAAEHLALTPERPAEPSAHGGPLAPLSIGVVAPETDVPVPPPIVRSSRPAERPVAAPQPTLRVTATPETPSQAVSEAHTANLEPTKTTDPQPSETAAAETTAPPPTTTTASETTGATETATETTETSTQTPIETTDPLGNLLEDMFDQGGSWWP